MRLRPSALFNIATDAPEGGGGTAAPTPTPAPAAPPAPETPPPAGDSASAVKPGVIAQATALLRGANGNAATIAALRADLTTRDATIEQLRSELAARDATITDLTTELTTYRTQAADLQVAVTALQTKQTDVQTEVIHQLAAAGLPESGLPKGSTSAAPQATAEELWQQAEAASDPKEKGRLANQALKLTEGKVHSLKATAALN